MLKIKGNGHRRGAVAAVCAAVVSSAVALTPGPGAAAAEKDRYTLLNPTPRAMMRELSPDRPDRTESPYTVDAGHVQVESDIFAYVRDDDHGSETESFAVLRSNLKLGLANNTDVQLVLAPYVKDRLDVPGGADRTIDGFGDLTLRLKQNIWGNDEGRTALALLPFVTFPTSRDGLGADDVEAGLAVPLAVKLSERLDLGLMTELDYAADAPADGGHWTWANTVVLDIGLTERLGAYVEFFSAVDVDNASDWVGTVDVGVTYALTPDVQLDAGVNIGVTDAADDFNPFVGITARY